MSYALRDGLAYCIPGDRIVFLDISAGRYFSLSEAKDLALRRWLDAQALDKEDVVHLDALLRQGVLVAAPSDPPGPRKRQPVITPASTQLDIAQVPTSGIGALRAVRAQLVWAWRTERWPPARVIKALRSTELRHKRREPRDDLERVTALARDFARADFVLGNHDRCLVRSLAFAAMARKRSIQASVVLGVQSDPFAAHCWVQHGDVVVNDHYERVRPFAPIMVI
ncbi:MAG: lasso peptide biosynthesis B2 protein [Sphingomonadales bacterium]|nr:lasso peptide biosynthesis B2 protein [Sphingomonadales bacterium]